jgi:integrase
MFALGSDIPCWWPRLVRSAAPGAVPVLVVVTGVRRGELCGLQIRDIDLDRGPRSLLKKLAGPGVLPA